MRDEATDWYTELGKGKWRHMSNLAKSLSYKGKILKPSVLFSFNLLGLKKKSHLIMLSSSGGHGCKKITLMSVKKREPQFPVWNSHIADCKRMFLWWYSNIASLLPFIQIKSVIRRTPTRTFLQEKKNMPFMVFRQTANAPLFLQTSYAFLNSNANTA